MMFRAKWFTDWLWRRTEKTREREPDFYIGGKENPYLLRWYIFRNPFFCVYHHLIVRSDDDRALHDHPWVSASCVLKGNMYEVLKHSYTDRDLHLGPEHRDLHEGTVALRTAKSAHRLVLYNGQSCFTLFVTGPRIRQWGFYCRSGWKHWRDFTSYSETGDSSVVGKGCGED